MADTSPDQDAEPIDKCFFFLFWSGLVLISLVWCYKKELKRHDWQLRPPLWWGHQKQDGSTRICHVFGFIFVQREEVETRRPSLFMSIEGTRVYGEDALKATRKEEEKEGGIREEVHKEWGETQVTVGAFQIKLVWERERRDGGMKRRVKSMSHADGWGQRIQAEKIYGEYELL